MQMPRLSSAPFAPPEEVCQDTPSSVDRSIPCVIVPAIAALPKVATEPATSRGSENPLVHVAPRSVLAQRHDTHGLPLKFSVVTYSFAGSQLFATIDQQS